MEKKGIRIVRTVGLTFASQILSSGLSYFTIIFIAKVLHPDDAGIFFWSFNAALLGSTILCFGFDQSLIREVSRALSSNHWAGIKQLFYSASVVSLALSGFAACCFLIFKENIIVFFFKDESINDIYLYMLLSVLFLAAAGILGATFHGIRKHITAVFLRKGFYPLIMLLLFFGALLMQRKIDVIFVAESHLLTTGLVFVIGLVYFFAILRKHDVRIPPRCGEGDVSPIRLGKTSFPFSQITVMSTFIGSFGTVLLGHFEKSDVVAGYYVAYRTSMLLAFPLSSINAIFAPRIAHLYHKKKLAKLKYYTHLNMVCCSLFGIIAFLALIFIVEVMLGYLGHDFAGGSLFFYILAVGQLFNLSTGSVGYLLTMTSYQETLRNVIFIAFVTNIVLCLVLIPSTGALGAAIATSISVILLKVVSVIMVNKKLKMLVIPDKGFYTELWDNIMNRL